MDQINNNQFTKTSVMFNMIWKFSERTASQMVSFIVTIVLARLLLPSEFGLIAMVTVFITIADVFVTSGFGSALIQKKDVDNLDYSSVFFFSIGFSIILYGIIFYIAPIIAVFYQYEILTIVMRVLGLRVIFAAVNSVQQAYVAKHLIFKKYFFSTISGTLISAVIGISMAYIGYGLWALVTQQMVNVTVNTIVLWSLLKWRPNLQFSVKRIKRLFSFGWKILLAGLLNTISNQIRHLIIGKMYSPSDLAYYDRGLKFPSLIMVNINTSISAVMFPVISNEQEDLERIKKLTRKSIRISSYFIFPIMMGLAVMAEPLVKLLLTEKWLPCIPYLRIGCFIHSVTIMQIAIQNAIMARGRSDIFLAMDIISKVFGIILLIMVMKKSVMAIALTALITGTFNTLMKAYVSKRLIGYRFHEHISDNAPIIILSTIMGIFVYLINFLKLSNILTIIIQITLGISIYLLLSLLFKLDEFSFSLNLIKKFKKGKTYV